MISPILPFYDRAEIKFSHGKGMYLYATDGTEYLDFAAGYAAVALGHCPDELVEVISEQAKKLWHLSNAYEIPMMKEYSQRLADNSFASSMFIASTGAEAVECMMKNG